MKKNYATIRSILMIFFAVGFVVSVIWYVREFRDVFSSLTAEQLIERVDVTLFYTMIEGSKEFKVFNAPIICGLAYIVAVPLTRGIFYLLSQRSENKSLKNSGK